MRVLLALVLAVSCGPLFAAEPKLNKDVFRVVAAGVPSVTSGKLESLLKEKGERPEGAGWKYDKEKKCWWRYAVPTVGTDPNCPTGNCPLPRR